MSLFWEANPTPTKSFHVLHLIPFGKIMWNCLQKGASGGVWSRMASLSWNIRCQSTVILFVSPQRSDWLWTDWKYWTVCPLVEGGASQRQHNSHSNWHDPRCLDRSSSHTDGSSYATPTVMETAMATTKIQEPKRCGCGSLTVLCWDLFAMPDASVRESHEYFMRSGQD
jgi:hypothetical protein